ncbi:MAG: hypothetical protein JWM33_1894 [Caulobacteraceae bacterium]|nr:hypothetical protein [Caulobacteraceae bacterium]
MTLWNPAMAAAFTLPAVLDLKLASGLAANLGALRGRDITLDASEVCRLGGQCLQVLLSAEKTWVGDGHTLAVVNPSPEFTEALALLGAAAFAPAQVEG